jgi:acyl-CoA dehydrogenase
MDFDYSPKVQALHAKLTAFMDEHLSERSRLPRRDRRQPRRRQCLGRDQIMEQLKRKARAAGLWNLFLPESELGAGLTNLGMRRCAKSWAACTGRRRCSTARRRTPATWKCWRATARRRSRQQWLEPLLDGRIRSCFGMTEPAVASSDATNISSIVRDGDDYVINGRKWWSSGANDPRCAVFIFMGKSDPTTPAATSSNR